MPFRYFTPGIQFISLAIAGVMSLISRPKKRGVRHISHSPSTQEDENVFNVTKIITKHSDCTAEVIPINVFGRKKVETFRLLSPGREVDLIMKNGYIKVFAYGEFIADLITPETSLVPKLFQQGIHFDAYLGGRDRAFLYDDGYDSCSIIIFYKMDGIPPTKVNVI